MMGFYIPTDVKVKQMKKAKSDCMTVQKKFSKDRDPVVITYEVWEKPSALKAEDWDWVVVVFLVRSDMPLRVLPKFIGVQLVNYHIPLYLKNTAPPIKALMSEFVAENKGDDGDLHTTYTGKGKGDDSESLMCYQSKSIAAAMSDINTRRVKGRKLVVELTSQSGVT
ncbi:unnamed protein product [Malus baccata var. baccata]